MTNFQKCNNIAKEFLLTQISGWKEMNDVYISYLVFREYFDDQIWNNSGKDFLFIFLDSALENLLSYVV